MAQSWVPPPPKPPFRERWRVAEPWFTLIASYGLLLWLAPFKVGLLSALLYCAPIILAVRTASATRVATDDHDAASAQRRWIIVLAGFAVLTALLGWLQSVLTDFVAVPRGIPSRAYLQVINVPDGYLDTSRSFAWNPRKHQADAYYRPYFFSLTGMDPSARWADTETVRAASTAPCAAMPYPYLVGAGDGENFHAAAACKKIGPRLWKILPQDDGGYEVAFARKTDGVTIQLAGDINDESALRRAIMGAHEATGMELWHRSPWLLALLK